MRLPDCILSVFQQIRIYTLKKSNLPVQKHCDKIRFKTYYASFGLQKTFQFGPNFCLLFSVNFINQQDVDPDTAITLSNKINRYNRNFSLGSGEKHTLVIQQLFCFPLYLVRQSLYYLELFDLCGVGSNELHLHLWQPTSQQQGQR